MHHQAAEGGIKLEPGELSGDQWERPRDAAHFWALVVRDGAISVSPAYTAVPAAVPALGSNPGHYLIAMKLNSTGIENYHVMRRDEATGEWWQTSLGWSAFSNYAVIYKDDRIATPHIDAWADPKLAAVHPLDLWVGYFWIPNLGLQGHPARHRGGCCYITTAACVALGLQDDCDELETLRWFRDHVMLRSADGRRDVEQYYANAPALLAAIKSCTDPQSVLAEMFENGIKPAVAAVKRKDYAAAHAIYWREVQKLERGMTRN